MDENKIINISTNGTAVSMETKDRLTIKLKNKGFNVTDKFDESAALTICIGGDGSLLRTLHAYDFPSTPFIGINTGHLGFFQEISPDELDEFIERYMKGKYEIQHLKTLHAYIQTDEESTAVQKIKGLNEIVIKSSKSNTIHLNLSIGNSLIEKFSGDGLLVSTPAGSTAYNYSLGGCIVDPRLDLLQVTPISPMNTTAYHSFTSSIILPSMLSIGVFPEEISSGGKVIVADGFEFHFEKIYGLKIFLSNSKVKLLRFEDYDFWGKVKSKFLWKQL